MRLFSFAKYRLLVLFFKRERERERWGERNKASKEIPSRSRQFNLKQQAAAAAARGGGGGGGGEVELLPFPLTYMGASLFLFFLSSFWRVANWGSRGTFAVPFSISDFESPE